MKTVSVFSVISLLAVSAFPAQQTGSMGMRIERVAEQGGAYMIETTGARFLIGSDGAVAAWQRIPQERKVLEVTLPKPPAAFHLQKQDDFACELSSPRAALALHADGVVVLKFSQAAEASFRGFFRPSYHAEKDGKWLFIDSQGGFAIYPVVKKRAGTPALEASSWSINQSFASGEEVWLSVFPPRPYNWERALQPIEHDGLPLEGVPGAFEGANAYPSNDQIRSAGRYCKILTLHAYIWQDAPPKFKEKTGKYAGHPQPWMTSQHVPTDMREFRRVREEAHRDGMKLVVYLSPFYSKAPDIFAEMQRVLDTYQVDGLYFDGVSEDFRKSYAVMRGARKILGDNRILYVHCSTDPLGDGRIYCPFIDTYADYILRGEAGRFGLSLHDFLRWTVSGYQISNAVGTWCYYGSNRRAQSEYICEPPTSQDIDAALHNYVTIWRQGDDWPEAGRKAEMERFDGEYYTKLQALWHEKHP